MRWSLRYLIAALGVALGVLAGVAIGVFAVWMLVGSATTYSSHPLDGLVPIVGWISLLISALVLMAAWRLSHLVRTVSAARSRLASDQSGH